MGSLPSRLVGTSHPIPVNGSRARAAFGKVALTLERFWPGMWANTQIPPGCPRCGQPMRHGFLAFGGRLSWVEKKSWLDPLRGEVIAEFPGLDTHLEGFRCLSCGVLSVRYEGGEPAGSTAAKPQSSE